MLGFKMFYIDKSVFDFAELAEDNYGGFSGGSFGTLQCFSLSSNDAKAQEIHTANSLGRPLLVCLNVCLYRFRKKCSNKLHGVFFILNVGFPLEASSRGSKATNRNPKTGHGAIEAIDGTTAGRVETAKIFFNQPFSSLVKTKIAMETSTHF